ncbi:citrate synthase/methylcitrate synthase [Bacillus horti]|uniref:Citrate synthase n=2 Tax=Caldalkalibacillus horti TaxID=77523 RepID=A0ABT9W526_9BACI|nr:citrate synthase/methylcitrate synthase [Bacillus horti]MDQ0168358.1 citrate synthase [Bacillus horti]
MKDIKKPSVTGLEGVVAADTAISLVDGDKGHLVLRGYWAKELALKHAFEEVAHLIWRGSLPSDDQFNQLKKKLANERDLPEYTINILKQLPEQMDMMSVLRALVGTFVLEGARWPPTLDQAVAITAKIPTIIAYRHRLIQGKALVAPKANLSHIENYLYMLSGEAPQPAHVQALEAYSILTMEHGMNASTFTARVISSTESDIVSAISGAIGAMKGPLHGGAPSGVIEMLEEIGNKEQVEAWIRGALERGERLMGFGHRVYKTHDPRSLALKEMIGSLEGQDEWLDLAYEVEKQAVELLEEFKPGRRLYTNVEFYAAAIMRAVQLPEQLFSPTFTLSRTVGWTAHVLEQAENNRIFRPQSTYIGRTPN